MDPGAINRDVAAGYRAMSAGDWASARDLFVAALDGAEVPEASLGLANVSFWLGDLMGTIGCCEAAYAGFRRRGDSMLAAVAALSLVGYNKGFLGNGAAAHGWLARAGRIIEAQVPPVAEHPGASWGAAGGHRVSDRRPAGQ